MNNHIYSTLFKTQERESDRRSKEIEQRKESQKNKKKTRTCDPSTELQSTALTLNLQPQWLRCIHILSVYMVLYSSLNYYQVLFNTCIHTVYIHVYIQCVYGVIQYICNMSPNPDYYLTLFNTHTHTVYSTYIHTYVYIPISSNRGLLRIEAGPV